MTAHQQKLLAVIKTIHLPRIKILFKLCRGQLPIKAVFAVTVSEAQGQTYNCAGIYLPSPPPHTVSSI